MTLRPLEIAAWTPPPDMSICDWIESNVELAGDAQEKGPYRFARVPYFRFIAEAFSDYRVKYIGLMAAAQIGKTWGFYAIIAYDVGQRQGRTLIVMADQATGEAVTEDRLHQVFKKSPNLCGIIGNLTKKQCSFLNGAKIDITWASSVAGLATFTCLLVYRDEVDKPGYSMTSKEASPLSLSEERVKAVQGGKILTSSTPTTESGNITKEMESSDTVFDFFVRCPYCNHAQPLRFSPEYCYGFENGQYIGEDAKPHRFGKIKWEGGRNATSEQIAAAGYQCGECGKIWSTIEKNRAVEDCFAFPRGGKINGLRKIFFHINRIYSLIGEAASIPVMVADFVTIMKMPEGPEKRKTLQGFVNSTLAEPWKEVVVETADIKILEARVDLPRHTVPENAIALTCAIDVQKYGFWFSVRAWARNFDSWLINYGKLATWEEVRELLFNTDYPVQGTENQRMGLWRAAIDTGGGEGQTEFSLTEEAYFFIRKYGIGYGCQVFATKGSSSPLLGRVMKLGGKIDTTPSGKALAGGLQLYLLDTDHLKSMVFARIMNAIERRDLASYLNADTGEDYAHQLTAEEQRRDEKGRLYWHQKRYDNHWLDTECLNHALASPDWSGVSLLKARAGVKKKQGGGDIRQQRARGQGGNWFKGVNSSDWFGRK